MARDCEDSSCSLVVLKRKKDCVSADDPKMICSAKRACKARHPVPGGQSRPFDQGRIDRRLFETDPTPFACRFDEQICRRPWDQLQLLAG